MIPKYMIEFANELQFMVVRSLKRKGSSVKKGKFSVSLKVEKYILKNYLSWLSKLNSMPFYLFYTLKEVHARYTCTFVLKCFIKIIY